MNDDNNGIKSLVEIARDFHGNLSELQSLIPKLELPTDDELEKFSANYEAACEIVNEGITSRIRELRLWIDGQERQTGSSADLASRLYNHDLSNTNYFFVESVKMLESYRKRGNPDEYEQAISKITRAGSHIQAFVNVMGYLAGHADGIEIPLEEIEASEVESMLRGSGYNEKQASRIIVTYDQDMRINSAEYVMITQLVKNAIKHTKSAVPVGMLEKESGVFVYVSDSGPGLQQSADTVADIFSEFSTTGGGLGLQVVDRLVELQGLHLGVTSAHGEQKVTYEKQGNTLVSTSSEDLGFTPHEPGTRFKIFRPYQSTT